MISLNLKITLLISIFNFLWLFSFFLIVEDVYKRQGRREMKQQNLNLKWYTLTLKLKQPTGSFSINFESF